VTAGFAVSLVAAPALLVGGAAALGRWWSGDRGRYLEVATRFAFALVPLGAAMWITHYTFHLLTSWDSALPAFWRWAADVGLAAGESSDWAYACCVAVAPWLLRLEIVFLDLGLLLSLYTGYRIARDRLPELPQALRAFAPWGVLIVLLFALGVWIVLQPMQMRGTLEMLG
jgi:hypothetical protein